METLSSLYKVKVSTLAVSSGDRGMCARMVQGLNSGPLSTCLATYTQLLWDVFIYFLAAFMTESK